MERINSIEFDNKLKYIIFFGILKLILITYNFNFFEALKKLIDLNSSLIGFEDNNFILKCIIKTKILCLEVQTI